MATPPRWLRRATARDLHYFQPPELWVRYPFLPVTTLRRCVYDGFDEMADDGWVVA